MDYAGSRAVGATDGCPRLLRATYDANDAWPPHVYAAARRWRRRDRGGTPVRGLSVPRGGGERRHARVRRVRVLVAEPRRPVRPDCGSAGCVHLFARDRAALRAVRPAGLLAVPPVMGRAPRRHDPVARPGLPAVRARGIRVPGRRAGALSRKRPPAHGRRDLAWLPIPRRVVLRAAHEGDARRWTDLVRRPSRVALACDRPRYHGRARRRVRSRSMAGCGSRGSETASPSRPKVPRSTSSPCPSRSGFAFQLRSRSSPGAA